MKRQGTFKRRMFSFTFFIDKHSIHSIKSPRVEALGYFVFLDTKGD